MSYNSNTTFIFVIGAPRSGTTWLHKMIAEHNEVYSLKGSNTFLHKYIFSLIDIYDLENELLTKKGFDRGLPSKLNKVEFNELLTDYIKRFYKVLPVDQNYYVEKATDITSEIHNIKSFIPNSKFIHIIRDGRNATVSQIKLRNKYGYPFGIENVFIGAHQWRDQVLEARKNSTKFSSDYLEIKYEDLFSNTEFFLNKIFDHIGIEDKNHEISNICNKYNYKSNAVSTPTSTVAKEDGKLKNAYKTDMSIFERALFEYIAGELLSKLGYTNESLLKNRLIWFWTKFAILPIAIIKHRLSKIKI